MRINNSAVIYKRSLSKSDAHSWRPVRRSEITKITEGGAPVFPPTAAACKRREVHRIGGGVAWKRGSEVIDYRDWGK